MAMTNAYIAVQMREPGEWYWRVECVEGYYPWDGPHRTERAAKYAGGKQLKVWLAREARRPEAVQ